MFYVEPFAITDSLVVRAATFRDGQAPVESTRSYLLLNSIGAQNGEGLPDTWGFLSDYEMDPDVLAQNRNVLGVLDHMSSVSITVDPGDLFSINEGIFANPLLEGDEWEKPVSIEFLGNEFDDDRTQTRLSSTGTIKVAGEAAERNPASTSKFSMEISFDEILNPALSGTGLFNSEADEFSGIMLRAGSADSWDERIERSTSASNLFTQSVHFGHTRRHGA